MLNRYDRTYATILFWLENPDTVLALANTEDGEIETVHTEPVVNSQGHVIIAGGTGYRVKPSNKNIDIHALLNGHMHIPNVGHFLKYFNRYVRPWANEFVKEWNRNAASGRTHVDDYGTVIPLYRLRKMREEGQYDSTFNWFPVPVCRFIEVCQLDRGEYDIDDMMQDLLLGVDLPAERYKVGSAISDELLTAVLSENAGKVTEYLAGKVGVLNMFFGEYLKRSVDKSVDKVKLRAAISDRLETMR